MTLDFRIVYIASGVLFSSAAQICMKLATNHEVFRIPWIAFIVCSMFSYLVSFVMYYFALKHFPISKVSPIMTIGVVLLVVLFGILTGEVLSIQQMIGILFGAFSILLILI